MFYLHKLHNNFPNCFTAVNHSIDNDRRMCIPQKSPPEKHVKQILNAKPCKKWMEFVLLLQRRIFCCLDNKSLFILSKPARIKRESFIQKECKCSNPTHNHKPQIAQQSRNANSVTQQKQRIGNVMSDIIKIHIFHHELLPIMPNYTV